ncbi:MAG: hypothetical protein SF123_10605 [Chloroflexota bacterium]|nr:hypothetical protein [Chloroflexota bacterium]
MQDTQGFSLADPDFKLITAKAILASTSANRIACIPHHPSSAKTSIQT